MGPDKGDFVAPPTSENANEAEQALPAQEEFWRPPARFGNVPVEANPLGWDSHRGYRKVYPQILLPTQVVDRVSFGNPMLSANRLFWGDNLHIMRQLPSESVDLIYVDPPFFSGRHYNVIFGDQNELRSFVDIWEGGMPGYLVWLNARLYEMKRLLKSTGLLFVHLDWHASHYVKQELDKLFGYDHLFNEIIWCYSSAGRTASRFASKHDTILAYRKGPRAKFRGDEVRIPMAAGNTSFGGAIEIGEDGKRYRVIRSKRFGREYRYDIERGKVPEDWWTDIQYLQWQHSERIGYPTQKPEALLERIVKACSDPGDVVADFFVGGGTTPVVAQRLGRAWLACDQSRVAVAITADRLARAVELTLGDKESSAPDFTVEHWGIYEAKRLAETPQDQFVQFVLRAFGAVSADSEAGIHGRKGTVPIWVGEADQNSRVTSADVQRFANAIRKTVRYQQDNLRDGIMLAWAFRPDAATASTRLREMENTDLNFVRLDLVNIDSGPFREHVQSLSTGRADYGKFLTFVQPPIVRVGWKQIGHLTIRFDVSETAVMNVGARIINVQWDLDFRKHFTSTEGFSFVRTEAREPALSVSHTFTASGLHRIACKVQDDAGGEGTWTGEVTVTA